MSEFRKRVELAAAIEKLVGILVREGASVLAEAIFPLHRDEVCGGCGRAQDPEAPCACWQSSMRGDK